ncbi:MAG: hypothetical protein Hyperionvirus12_29 [Hyperionvirus sp.]|uniref:Endonuclease V n=1 Tax=Hyperionvirus sp. TaxID=2487770 RepID=A0A3G5A9R9_9VIRU|nr:MAG: hypothetical protein Hyperionvirus12_29 [Hyperionvirus sp.]
MAGFLAEIPKLRDVVVRGLGDFRLGFFVDNSGSTVDVLNGGRRVLEYELEMVSAFGGEYDLSKCVYWNTVAGCFSSKIESMGGTDPCCIMSNKATELIFDNSQVVFFMTDGQIGGDSVTKFSKLLEGRLDKALIVCVLFAKNMVNPDISVFAPFFVGKNVLIIQSDGVMNKVLHTIGICGGVFAKGGVWTVDEIRGHKIKNNYPRIPEGFNILSESEESVKVFSLGEFIKSDDEKVDVAGLVTLEEWDVIVRMAKMSGVMEGVRRKVNGLRNGSLNALANELKKGIAMPYVIEKHKVIGEIMKNKGGDENKKLVMRLQELLPLARVEETEAAKYIGGMSGKVRGYWDGVRNVLAHYETAGYTLNDLTGIANRAKRAKDISGEDTESAMGVVVHERVVEIDCCLHLDKGPAVVWLDKPKEGDLEVAMGDHALTFPLDNFPGLGECLRVNPVCGECAAAYMAHSNGYSVYKDTLMGFIPIDIKNNRRFVKSQLCKILCNSKLLSHVEMLLLGIVDDAEFKWFDEGVKEHLVRELIDNVMTNDTFGEEGKRVTLREAVLGLDAEKVLRQPIVAAFRLLGYLIKFDGKKKHQALIMLKERVAYKLIEMMLYTFLHDGKEGMYERINNKLYRVICGIPCLDGPDEVRLPSFEEVMSDMPVVMMKMLERIGRVDEMLPKEFIGQILCSLKMVGEHERPLTVYQKLVKNEMFSGAYCATVESAKGVLVNSITGGYFKTKTLFIPPYACYASIHSSPTKLFFMKEPLLGGDEVKFDNEKELVRKLQIRLGQKLKEAYGNAYPTDRTSHTTLHKMVASVLEGENFITAKTASDEMYAACVDALRKTNGKRGNIYNRKMLYAVVYCVNDFLRVRNDFFAKGMKRKDFDMNAVDFVKKLRNELTFYGMGDCVMYEKMGVPECLSVTYAGVDAIGVVERLNARPLGEEKKGDVEGLELKFAEIFVINVGEGEQKIEDWKSEQENILKEVNLSDTIKEDAVKLIAGMDISFDKDNDQRAVASMVIFQYPSLKVVAKASIRCSTNIKYIAGFLAFREVPILMKLYQLLKDCGVKPDLILMDGNGVWHPRFCGVASHFSVLGGVPCVGISKKVLVVEDINEEKVFNLIKDSEEGSMQKVITASGKILGMAYNVTGSYKNATYISAGNGLSLETAANIVSKVTIHRVTEPIRQADLLSRKLLETWK